MMGVVVPPEPVDEVAVGVLAGVGPACVENFEEG